MKTLQEVRDIKDTIKNRPLLQREREVSSFHLLVSTYKTIKTLVRFYHGCKKDDSGKIILNYTKWILREQNWLVYMDKYIYIVKDDILF